MPRPRTYISECCSKPMFNVEKLINEYYGTCTGCGKSDVLAHDTEMLKPVSLDSLKKYVPENSREEENRKYFEESNILTLEQIDGLKTKSPNAD